MAAAADLTLKNAAAANVTFNVYSVNPDSVEWTEAGATSILATSRFVLSRKIPADKTGGVYRIGGKITRPVVNSTTGVLDGVNTFTFEFLRPAKLTTAEVSELVARAQSAVAQAIILAAVQNGAIPT